MSAGIPSDHSYYELYQQCLLERNDLKAKLAEAQATLAETDHLIPKGMAFEGMVQQRDQWRAQAEALAKALDKLIWHATDAHDIGRAKDTLAAFETFKKEKAK